MSFSPLFNPLPSLWISFQMTENAFKVAKRAIRSPVVQSVDCQVELLNYQRHLLNHTKFPTKGNIEQLINKVKKIVKICLF